MKFLGMDSFKRHMGWGVVIVVAIKCGNASVFLMIILYVSL